MLWLVVDGSTLNVLSFYVVLYVWRHAERVDDGYRYQHVHKMVIDDVVGTIYVFYGICYLGSRRMNDGLSLHLPISGD